MKVDPGAKVWDFRRELLKLPTDKRGSGGKFFEPLVPAHVRGTKIEGVALLSQGQKK